MALKVPLWHNFVVSFFFVKIFDLNVLSLDVWHPENDESWDDCD
jgi:hypothetical protein